MDDLTVPDRRSSATAPQNIIQQAPQSLSLLPGLSIPAPATTSQGQGPQGASMNYNNSDDVSAVRAANATNAPQGGMANPGIYGLLPHNLQHGTLRNVLGALGDAFLTGANKPTEYEPRMQRQEIGDAMAGYNPEDPDSVRAAASRVAATGATGAPEMADKLQQQAEQAALRRATIEQTGVYRQSLMQNKDDSQVRALIPQISGMVNLSRNPQEYAARYAQAEAIAQRIGPNYHASDFGLLDPSVWQPGTQQGLTANNQQVSTDKAAQRATSRRNTDVNAGSRITSAGISANRETPTTRIEYLTGKANKAEAGMGPPLTAAEQAEFAHDTQVGRNTRRPSPSNAAAGTPEAAGAGLGSMIGGNGPGAPDIAYLRAHPNLRAQFDSHFGRGAAAQILGR